MEHPDNGFIQAFLDGEVGGSEAGQLRDHLGKCGECRGQLEILEAASRASAQAFKLLDREPCLDEVRRRVVQSQASHTDAKKKDGRRQGLLWGISLPRAASIALLLTGVAASALPGSPVRRWVVQGWRSLTQQPAVAPQSSEGPGAIEDPAATIQEATPPETGAGIPTLGGGVEIWIHELPPDAELRILWTDGEEAWVYAAEGTRFNRAAGRLEAFGPPGPVRIEIPRSVQSVIVGLDDAILLRKTGDEVEILGPVQERTPAEIRFEAPGRSNAG